MILKLTPFGGISFFLWVVKLTTYYFSFHGTDVSG